MEFCESHHATQIFEQERQRIEVRRDRKRKWQAEWALQCNLEYLAKHGFRSSPLVTTSSPQDTLHPLVQAALSLMSHMTDFLAVPAEYTRERFLHHYQTAVYWRILHLIHKSLGPDLLPIWATHMTVSYPESLQAEIFTQWQTTPFPSFASSFSAEDLVFHVLSAYLHMSVSVFSPEFQVQKDLQWLHEFGVLSFFQQWYAHNPRQCCLVQWIPSFVKRLEDRYPVSYQDQTIQAYRKALQL